MRGRRRGRHRFANLARWRGQHDSTASMPTEGSPTARHDDGTARQGNSGMHIVLWDTRHGGAFKDFAGGFGVGQYRGRGLRSKIIEHFYRRDFRSPPLAYGYLAAGFSNLGHTVDYCLEEIPPADVYIFNPALMTLPYELEVIRKLKDSAPRTQILVVGQ